MEKRNIGRFQVHAIAQAFPDSAASMLLDTYLTNEESASARVFRVYRPTPAHFHLHSDEYLYVISGRGTFWMVDASEESDFAPGDLLFFKRTVVHALPVILEDPVVFLSIDAPRRHPDDIHFVDSDAGTPASFIQPLER